MKEQLGYIGNRIRDPNTCLKGEVKILTKRLGIYNRDDMQAVSKVQGNEHKLI